MNKCQHFVFPLTNPIHFVYNSDMKIELTLIEDGFKMTETIDLYGRDKELEEVSKALSCFGVSVSTRIRHKMTIRKISNAIRRRA